MVWPVGPFLGQVVCVADEVGLQKSVVRGRVAGGLAAALKVNSMALGARVGVISM